jgi:hypothetical protein
MLATSVNLDNRGLSYALAECISIALSLPFEATTSTIAEGHMDSAVMRVFAQARRS